MLLSDEQYHAALDHALRTAKERSKNRTSLPIPELEAICSEFRSALRIVVDAKRSPELIAIANAKTP